jgi:hypothetical protein
MLRVGHGQLSSAHTLPSSVMCGDEGYVLSSSASPARVARGSPLSPIDWVWSTRLTCGSGGRLSSAAARVRRLPWDLGHPVEDAVDVNRQGRAHTRETPAVRPLQVFGSFAWAIFCRPPTRTRWGPAAIRSGYVDWQSGSTAGNSDPDVPPGCSSGCREATRRAPRAWPYSLRPREPDLVDRSCRRATKSTSARLMGVPVAEVSCR